MEVHQNLHTLTSGTFARLKRVFNERLDLWGIETANALAAHPPCTFNFREETLAVWVPVSEDQANLAPGSAPALGTFRGSRPAPEFARVRPADRDAAFGAMLLHI